MHYKKKEMKIHKLYYVVKTAVIYTCIRFNDL